MTHALTLPRPIAKLPISTRILTLCLALFTVLVVLNPAHAHTAVPAAIVGGLSALCGASIGFGVVAVLALAAGTGGFGAALGVSAAIHIAALAC